jgi:hypothetical protein
VAVLPSEHLCGGRQDNNLNHTQPSTMRFLIILPLLGAIALASDLVGDKCQCPQVKCAGDNEAVSYTSFLQRDIVPLTMFRPSANASMTTRPGAQRNVQSTSQNIRYIPAVYRSFKNQTNGTISPAQFHHQHQLLNRPALVFPSQAQSQHPSP